MKRAEWFLTFLLDAASTYWEIDLAACWGRTVARRRKDEMDNGRIGVNIAYNSTGCMFHKNGAVCAL